MMIRNINEYYNNGKAMPTTKGRPRLRNERSECGQTKKRPRDAHVTKGIFVYFIAGTGRTTVKVGRTTNLTKRIESIQIGNPETVRVAALIEVASVEDAKAVEQFLHRKFKGAGRHIGGEWFRLWPNDVGDACLLCGIEFAGRATARFVAGLAADEENRDHNRTYVSGSGYAGRNHGLR
ncbi:GIY-YIG nuclease family protein [Mesorhizobium sp. M7D.F.Ca.US.005.01.1.1]|uniref:GIY-YIG nuclease family protein n=1 Tax=Mesorhizobium sp. M7D.F.Ca.US.005.01.1.1 TaxID=2493678 RepID=UPI000F751A36|nr:GIY-YIG nuclease family protein [Mesorhizobium sp. M7D.F.Ca.US.005.01.1.1]AZO45895.1 GIY-YIG nuclease family protein [Mesorhizobium sp. M7D.F.Ca.US.005.01.1.1]